MAVGCLHVIRFLALPNLEKVLPQPCPSLRCQHVSQVAHIARECVYPIATPLLVAGWSHSLISPKLKFLEAIPIIEEHNRVALVVVLTIVIAHT